jgi:mono/diheme cytochrome c family protein
MPRRLLAALALCATACLTARAPVTEPVDRTPARVARGAYLARNLLGCVGCHSPRDWSKYLGPPLEGQWMSGGPPMDEALGLPGSMVPGNLTPDEETGMGTATDGELLRAVREGVGRDGRALFPVMPYPAYRALSDDDAQAVVAWLRTLPAVRHQAGATHINFPVGLFIRGVPKPVLQPVPAPSEAERGAYLLRVAGCRDCHSPVNGRGQVIAERAWTGGRPLPGPGFTSVSADLSGTRGTWLATATRAQFIERFKAFEHADEAPLPAAPGVNSHMPWNEYGRLTVEDLGAMYDALKALPPRP